MQNVANAYAWDGRGRRSGPGSVTLTLLPLSI